MTTRRETLLGLAGFGFGMLLPSRMALAQAPTERRLVFIILRGAMDGLHAVPPVGDNHYHGQRGKLAEADQPRRLDNMFGLHSRLRAAGELYDASQLLFVHACASPYRERSHFDGQDVLETGGTRPFESRIGWMNRLSGLVGGEALALAPTIPVALRGSAPVSSYAPSGLPAADQDLLERVGVLYEPDPELHALWKQALEARSLAGDKGFIRQDPAELGRTAARFLTAPNGARLVMIETGGWDTHAQEAPRLANILGHLDQLIANLREALGLAWSETLVMAMTEFGRTVAVNGTGGTDHGSASAMILAGGTVVGGRVVADWPGLAPASLLGGRDLRPTTDIRTVLVGAAATHFGIDPAEAGTKMLAESLAARPMEGLVRA